MVFYSYLCSPIPRRPCSNACAPQFVAKAAQQGLESSSSSPGRDGIVGVFRQRPTAAHKRRRLPKHLLPFARLFDELLERHRGMSAPGGGASVTHSRSAAGGAHDARTSTSSSEATKRKTGYKTLLERHCARKIERSDLLRPADIHSEKCLGFAQSHTSVCQFLED